MEFRKGEAPNENLIHRIQKFFYIFLHVLEFLLLLILIITTLITVYVLQQCQNIYNCGKYEKIRNQFFELIFLFCCKQATVFNSETCKINTWTSKFYQYWWDNSDCWEKFEGDKLAGQNSNLVILQWDLYRSPLEQRQSL